MEFERQIEDESLILHGRICGYDPVQAEGAIANKRFYFRARWEAWSFAVADSEDVDPVRYLSARTGGSARREHGNLLQFAASYIAYDVAEEIIKRCAREFLSSR